MIPQALGGLHEACFGVPDLADAAEYWKAFGYTVIGRGRLSADAAEMLYGVPSALESLRLPKMLSDVANESCHLPNRNVLRHMIRPSLRMTTDC